MQVPPRVAAGKRGGRLSGLEPYPRGLPLLAAHLVLHEPIGAVLPAVVSTLDGLGFAQEAAG